MPNGREFIEQMNRGGEKHFDDPLTSPVRTKSVRFSSIPGSAVRRAELLVIRQASDPVALLHAWHISLEDKFDFNAGAQRVEVKRTSQRVRIHNFSLEQLMPPTGCRVIVVSLFVEKAARGTSVESLKDEIRELAEARPDLQERLDPVVASTLGSTLRQSLTERFDRELPCESMLWFDGGAIPIIPTPLPWGISDVHFRADLSQSPPISRQTLGVEGGIFAALVGNVPTPHVWGLPTDTGHFVQLEWAAFSDFSISGERKRTRLGGRPPPWRKPLLFGICDVTGSC